MKKRILFVTHAFAMGGANHSMFQLMKELKATGYVEPIVLVPLQGINPINIVNKCREIGISCVTAHFYWFKSDSYIKPFIRMLLNFFLFYPLILYKLRKYDFDLVHSNGSVVDVGGYISRCRKVKHVWHLREFGMLDFKLFSVLGKHYERFAYGMGDVFIAISKRVAQEYTNVIPENKIRLIYNGVVPKDKKWSSKHINDKMQMVMVGRIQVTKNQLEALRAVNGLVKEGCTHFHFNIIGASEVEYLNTLKDYVKDNQLESYVTFWGERDDVPDLLSKMDVGLMLSNNEAFGRVTIEYMLQNVAVIASNTGANTELISDGETGLLYPLGDVEMLIEKMRMLIENQALMLEIARKGQEHAVIHFTSQKNTKSVLDVYQSLIAN